MTDIIADGPVAEVVQQLVVDIDHAHDWTLDINLAVARSARALQTMTKADCGAYARYYAVTILDALEACDARIGNPQPEGTLEWILNGMPPADGFCEADLVARGALSSLVGALENLRSEDGGRNDFYALESRCADAALVSCLPTAA
jgi:hypothetical protein